MSGLATRQLHSVRSFWRDMPTEEADNDGAALAEQWGGKAAQLIRLCQAGFPVPAGFVIAIERARSILETGQWPDGLEQEVRGALAELEVRAGRKFGTGANPLLVAVRSGAAISMPGMLDTILHCGNRSESTSARTSTPWDQLRCSIDSVIHSWNSRRARDYREYRSLTHLRGTAVIVQAMFPACVSGVLFTRNPQDLARSEMLLESVAGMGDALVSGSVTPIAYRIDGDTQELQRLSPTPPAAPMPPSTSIPPRSDARDPRKRVDSSQPHESLAQDTSMDASQPIRGMDSVGNSESADYRLLTARIHELIEAGKRIETLLGGPSDIEWAIGDRDWAILQARLLPGLEVAAEMARARQDELERLRSLAQDRRKVWALHNLAESLPCATPLTADLWKRMFSSRGGWGSFYSALGYCPEDNGESILEFIAGRPYVESRRQASLFFGGLPIEYELDSLNDDPARLDRPPANIDWERASPFFFLQVPRLLGILWRVARRSRAWERDGIARFERFLTDHLGPFLDSCSSSRLESLDDDSLAREWCRRCDFVLGPLAAETALPGYHGGLAYLRLAHWLARLLGPAEGQQWAARLTSGLADSVAAQQMIELNKIARGESNWEEFLSKHGHRGVGEMELSRPRWSEDQTSLTRLVERLQEANSVPPSTRAEQQCAEQQYTEQRKSEEALFERLCSSGASSLHEETLTRARAARRLLPYRDLGRHEFLRGYATLRSIALEWGRRWQLGDDIFFIHAEDLSAQKPSASESQRGTLRTQIARVKQRHAAAARLDLPQVIDSTHWNDLHPTRSILAPPLARSERAGDAETETWPARPLSPGHVSGTAHVIRDVSELELLGDDAILVCASTDPGWTPQLIRASGLIVERGGVLSHGALVARDFGVPAVALDDATMRIRTGDVLSLDANLGRVTLTRRSLA